MSPKKAKAQTSQFPSLVREMDIDIQKLKILRHVSVTRHKFELIS